jgi:hypothetical protein
MLVNINIPSFELLKSFSDPRYEVILTTLPEGYLKWTEFSREYFLCNFFRDLCIGLADKEIARFFNAEFTYWFTRVTMFDGLETTEVVRSLQFSVLEYPLRVSAYAFSSITNSIKLRHAFLEAIVEGKESFEVEL